MAVTDWYEATIAHHSAAAIACAVRASRVVIVDALERVLPEIERLYIDDLLKTADTAEGISAFLDKRAPRWQDR